MGSFGLWWIETTHKFKHFIGALNGQRSTGGGGLVTRLVGRMSASIFDVVVPTNRQIYLIVEHMVDRWWMVDWGSDCCIHIFM